MDQFNDDFRGKQGIESNKWYQTEHGKTEK
jgi:hypothetical protein